jgi:hypothetical protein
MSYRDFANGLTAAQLKHQRQQREDSDLQSAMHTCWRESERILGILRSMGSVPVTTEGVEAWFSGVKGSAHVAGRSKCTTSGRNERLESAPLLVRENSSI